MGSMFVCPQCAERFEGAGFCPRDGAPLQDTALDPILGLDFGPYRAARKIGAGGMGQVYLGLQPHIGSRVAIKLLSAECASNQALVERFFNEARAVNVIRHESIVNVLDLSRTADGRPYIVMEYLDGSPLSELIAERGALPVRSTLYLALDVLSALSAAHAVGVVHRDIKPDNLFVTPTGRVKLLDFGIAKLRPTLGEASHRTRTGALLGTPYYMSPEQALGREADARSDVYSFGIVLYQMLTGRLPFVSENLYELLKQQVETLPPSPRSLRPELPPALEWALLGTLQKDPTHRFASAAALYEALAQLVATLPQDGSPPLLGKGTGSAVTPVGAQQVPSPLGLSPASAPLGPQVPGVTPPAAVWTPPPSSRKRPGALAMVSLVAALLLFVAGGLWLGWLGVRAVTQRAAAAWTERASGESQSTTSPLGASSPTAQEASAPAEEEGDVPSAASGPNAPIELKALSDRHRVPVLPHLQAARAEALHTFADARLVRIDITGMKPDGTVDLDVSGEFASSILFRWRSPKASEPPAGLPGGAKHRSRCLFYYLISDQGQTSYTTDLLDCDEPLVEMPRCAPTAVWARAVAAGAPSGNYIGNLSYFATEERPASWLVQIGDYSAFLADDC